MKNFFRILGVFLLFCISEQGFSQEKEQDSIEFKVSLSTPYDALVTHLSYLQDDNYYPGVSALSFDSSGGFDLASRRSYAIKLKQIYDGLDKYIDIDKVPKNPNFRDSTRNNGFIYVVDESLPQIRLVKKGSIWVYSSETIEVIPEKHREVYPFGTHKFLELAEYLNDSHDRYFGLYTWQYVGLFIFIFTAFALYYISRFFVEKGIKRIFKRFKKAEIAKTYIIPVAKPLSMLLIVLFLMFTFPILQLPFFANKYVMLIFKIAVPFYCILVLYRLIGISTIFFDKLADQTESTLDDQLIPLLTKTLKVL